MNKGKKDCNFIINEKARTILFMFLLETDDQNAFKRAYKALTFCPGKSEETSYDPRKCCTRVFAKTMRRSIYD